MFSVFLLPYAGRIVEKLFAGSFQDDQESFLVVAALILGVYLFRWLAFLLLGFGKKRKKDGGEGFFFIWLLNLPSSLLGMAFLVIAIVVPLKNAGVVDLTAGDAPIGVMGLSILAIEAVLLFRLLQIDFDSEVPRLTVLVSYLAIFGYVFVFQCLFSYFLTVLLGFGSSSVFHFLFAIFVSILAFVMFYAGPRSLLLYDESRWGFAILRMCVVFVVSVLTRLILG